MDQIDTNLYSRQIGTFGLETMGKLIQMNVVIVGMRGLGVEIAKNLILAGPKSVQIYDPQTASINDQGANFYIDSAHVGKASRASASISKLQELNPYVKVSEIQSESEFEAAVQSGTIHVVCQTELLLNGKYLDPKQLDSLCRKVQCGYISTQTFGPWGYAFVDYGEAHVVTDHDGEATKNFIVSSIEKGKTTLVTVHEDKRHSYQEGDYVIFREVEGMTQINNRDPVKIVSATTYGFTVDLDSTGFAEYTRQGVVENIKVPKTISFHPLEQSLLNPAASEVDGCLTVPDLSKFGRSEQLHAALLGVLSFVQANSQLPYGANNIGQCKELANKIISDASVGFKVEIEDPVFEKACLYTDCSISPMAAFFGGIVAQEIVKKTGKYSPLKQWLHFDIFETLTRGDANRTPLNSRYDDQIKIYGQELQQKLGKVNTFMVGAGALGCELIKAFALMGVGCGSGKVHVTDNDNIEVSNLNRQFLFRQGNVGHSKSKTACEIAKGMNNSLNVQDYMTRVGKDTEEVFNDKFWENLDFVVNAVDNIHARLYVDGRCVWYEKPLLESGTLGTKANSQMIIPHKTQCYGDSTDPPEEAIPMCTLRNFPNQIEHCIEWGRDKFNELFVDAPGDLVSYLDNPKLFVAQLKQNSTSSGMVTSLEKILHLLKLKSEKSGFDKCIWLAKEQFNNYYDFTIQDLLSIFPKDAKDKDGQPFWSGPKRAPSPVKFDSSNEKHLSFIVSYSNLIAAALKIDQVHDLAQIAKMADAAVTSAYKPKKIEVKLPGEEANAQPAQEPPSQDDEALCESLLAQIEVIRPSVSKNDFQPHEFEKDDDTNFHIEFIDAAANLRAINYEIKTCDRQKTKMIAGKIIPAIATTTAMITGAVSAEIYKFVQGYTEIENVKNSFINLAIPLFLFSEPSEVNKIKSKDYDPISMCKTKSIPEGYTIYDKTVVDKGSLTFQELFTHLETTYNIEVTLVSAGNYALYNSYLPGNKHKPRLQMKVEDVYKEVSTEPLVGGRNYIQMEMGGSCKDEDDTDFQMPTLKYIFTK